MRENQRNFIYILKNWFNYIKYRPLFISFPNLKLNQYKKKQTNMKIISVLRNMIDLFR